MMHSIPARVIRFVGGLWIVMSGVDLPLGYAMAVAILGTAIAVTGMVAFRPTAEVSYTCAKSATSSGPHQRAA